MGEHRLYLLSGLVQLVEKSPHIGTVPLHLSVQRKWIEDKDPLPTPREKATILVKMMSYELKGNEELLNDYLKLILDIYQSSSYSRSEFTVKLEPAFLLGCRKAAIQPSSFLLIWIRYLAKTYAAWYTAIENLQEVLDEVVDFNQDAQNVSHNENQTSSRKQREVAGEALAQLYAELGETDIFYGQWRRKSLCIETNAAMSYEQIG
ncbi:hypothetical protein PGT21_000111 [Puccinia graminis f. sp. tritici]|uniref:U3 snoRNP protein n=1 Tax=Puccinia graminis f. sp. tritici TaxID=56615 RepID=A0A5B0MI45_PUCGR|nr:hypothetical protein PGT21_000111 [Puccinia graminis f. sp. tritici]